jgi:hypothetical protein
LAIYKPNLDYGHALTCWGYDTDANGNYTGVWVTDSDDNATALKEYSVSWDGSTGFWDLGGVYTGYYIGEIEALGRNVPIPASLLLLGSGLLVLAPWRRLRRE